MQWTKHIFEVSSSLFSIPQCFRYSFNREGNALLGSQLLCMFNCEGLRFLSISYIEIASKYDWNFRIITKLLNLEREPIQHNPLHISAHCPPHYRLRLPYSYTHVRHVLRGYSFYPSVFSVYYPFSLISVKLCGKEEAGCRFLTLSIEFIPFLTRIYSASLTLYRRSADCFI